MTTDSVKLDPVSEIKDLNEAGPDGGELVGFYCRGHVVRYEFAEACNQRSGARSGYDARLVRAGECRHEWWRTVPMGGEDGYSRFIAAEPGARGAYKVTVWDGLSRRRAYGMRDYIATDRAGFRRGFAEGVAWALNTLAGEQEAHQRLLACWRGRGQAEMAKQAEEA